MKCKPHLYREWLASLQPGDPVAAESSVLVQRRTATREILHGLRRFGTDGRERGGGNAGPGLVRPSEG